MNTIRCSANKIFVCATPPVSLFFKFNDRGPKSKLRFLSPRSMRIKYLGNANHYRTVGITSRVQLQS